MTTRIVIPARLESSRLPGKVLLSIGGRSMLEWVWRAALESQVGAVCIATNHRKVARAAKAFGAEVHMTGDHHASGTDRIAQVAADLAWADDDLVINLQGDEPQMPPQCLRQLALLAQLHPGAVCSLFQAIHARNELEDPAVVKVVTDDQGRALYFSRAPIPWPRNGQPDWRSGLFRRHLGLYAYPVRALRLLAHLPPAPCELVEKLEQLRLLYAGIDLYLQAAECPVPAGVDTEDDLQRVQSQWARHDH